MARAERVQFIGNIESLRKSRLISYICSDRQNASGQIGEDAVRPLYDHVRQIGKTDKIDLYLYSRGGAVEVPWRIISTLREYCKELNVLIPYRAQSAATLIALGCDHVVMGGKAELGPIDPAVNRIKQESGTVFQEEIRIEDVMSYINFIKDRAGLGDQSAIAASVGILADKLTPWLLGSIYRTHSHIRMVARKLLVCRKVRMEDQKLNLIVESLAEKIYLHGHGIGRAEAKELGLPIECPADDLEEMMWKLLEEYETVMEMRRPVDPDALLGDNLDQQQIPITLAMIESASLTWAFQRELKLTRVRQAANQVNINLNLGVSLPDGVQPSAIPQEVINQLLRQIQNEVPKLVQQQVRDQSAILRTDGKLQNAYWRDVTGQGI